MRYVLLTLLTYLLAAIVCDHRNEHHSAADENVTPNNIHEYEQQNGHHAIELGDAQPGPDGGTYQSFFKRQQ